MSQESWASIAEKLLKTDGGPQARTKILEHLARIEVPEEFSALNVLVARHAEPVVAAAAHPVMVEFLPVRRPVVSEEFDR